MTNGLFIEPLMSEEHALQATTETERRAVALFPAERRREYLTWRAMLRREIGPAEIVYNAVGAPVVVDRDELCIGVSHGAGRVALCISDAPCAVDIERLDRNFDRISSRYLTPDERALSTDPHFAAVVWCAKETLYKLSGEQGLDLLSDLRITAIGKGWVEGRIKKREPLKLSFHYFDDAVVVWYLRSE